MKRIKMSVFTVGALIAIASLAYAAGPRGRHGDRHENATVSFGAWMTTPALDRFPNASPRTANHHELLPNEVTICAGGSVNFNIAGFHLVLVYDNGIQPGDIRTNMLIPPTNQPMPPLINDPAGRIYRGLDPSTQLQDRVEVVHFSKPGTYLVMCGVLPHFNEGMFGYVRVLPCGSGHH